MTQGLDVVVKSHKTQGMFAVTTDYSCRAHTSEHRLLLCVHVVPSKVVINMCNSTHTTFSQVNLSRIGKQETEVVELLECLWMHTW